MQTAVEIKSQGLTLRGMLHKPDTIMGKCPMVCVFHGFTGNKMEPHFIFVKLSRQLEKLGIASVRFDFSCSGESDGDFINMTITRELVDAKNILAYARSLDFVDSENIGIVGLSMGGVVASLLARDCQEMIQTLCLWAPASNMRQVTQSGEGQDAIAVQRNGYASIGGLPVGVPFLEELLTLDLLFELGAFDKNVLILHGDQDITVPLEASDPYLKLYGNKAKRIIIKNADHTFNHVDWEKEVISETLAHLTSELLG